MFQLRRALAAGVGAVCLSVAILPSASAADSPDVTDASELTVRAGDQEWTFDEFIELGGNLESEDSSDAPAIQPMLLGPVDLLECNVLNNADHMIISYDTMARSGWPGGVLRLFCGTLSSGYKHIDDRHAADWISKGESIGYYEQPWDDLMDSAVWVSTLGESSAGITVNQGSGKWCMTTPMTFWIGDQLVGTMDPRIILSENNMLVITAIPGGGC
ncbi:MAG: hypothetical protein ACREQ3_26275 [Candidatus Binatia bacterium]